MDPSAQQLEAYEQRITYVLTLLDEDVVEAEQVAQRLRRQVHSYASELKQTNHLVQRWTRFFRQFGESLESGYSTSGWNSQSTIGKTNSPVLPPTPSFGELMQTEDFEQALPATPLNVC